MRHPISIRPAEASDFEAWFGLFEAVATEGRWIGAEAPLDRRWAEPMFHRRLADRTAATFLAEVSTTLVGTIGIELQLGCAELGMMVRDGYRGQGVGSALLDACIDWSRRLGAHKVTLSVFPHNESAIALYRKFGFRTEGRLVRHWRRRDGALWDLIPMGLDLDPTAPGSPFDDVPPDD